MFSAYFNNNNNNNNNKLKKTNSSERVRKFKIQAKNFYFGLFKRNQQNI